MEELQENMKLLLDCLHYQQDSISSQKQALTTIAAMCSNHDTLCDHFRAAGGVNYVLKLLLETKSSELQIAAMYTLGCGCEQNMVSQRVLCTQTVFTFVHSLLSVGSNKAVKLTAAYFVTCLMNGNVVGQNLARDLCVLETLIDLYKQLHPNENKLQYTSEDIGLTEDAKLWISISSALCTAANNPQNELNQNMCSQILPAALSIFASTMTFQINLIRSAATVISACVANNSMVQERLRLIGGLRICIQALKSLIAYSTNVHKMEAAAHIVKIIFTATADEKSCKTLSQLETVSVFLKLLQISSLDITTKLNTVICLGMITEVCAKSRALVTEVGIPILIDLMATSKNEELSRTTTLVIKSCMEQAGLISGEQCTKSEDTTTSEVVDRILIEAEGSSPLNKLSLQALDNKKLSLKDNIVKWLTTSDSGLYKSEERKDEPANVVHCSPMAAKDQRQSFQKLSFPGVIHMKQTLHDASLCALDCKSNQTKPMDGSGSIECTLEKCDHGNSVVQRGEKIQCTKGLQQPVLVTAGSKATMVTPMNDLLYVPQSTKPNIRYSTKHQPASLFHKQCSYTCGIDPHQIPRSTAVRAHYDLSCRGCTPSKYPLLTSRNFCSFLLDDSHTCTFHKQLLSMLHGSVSEAQSTYCDVALDSDRNVTMQKGMEKTTACFCASNDKHMMGGKIDDGELRLQHSEQNTNITKLAAPSCPNVKHIPLRDMTNFSQNDTQLPHQLQCMASKASQKILPARFTEEESQSLITGVRTLGKRWHYILAAYPFNPCRTTVDLKDHYRVLHAKGLIS